MASAPDLRLNEPLRLTDVLAEAVRAYGRWLAPLVGIGLLQAGAFLLQEVLPWGPNLAILAAVFVVSYGLVVRMLVGDDVRDAIGRVWASLPLLLLLAVGIAVPFYLALSFLIFIPIAVIWLAVFSYTIPASLLEPRGADRAQPILSRAAWVIRRSAYLARTDFGHSLSVVVVLMLLYLFVGVLFAGLLASFGDNSQSAAIAIVQVILAPLFFLGLAVLYFSQRARADTGDRPLSRPR